MLIRTGICTDATAQGEEYLLIGGVVGLELLVVGELDVDWMVPDDGHHCGVIAHHVLSSFLRVHL